MLTKLDFENYHLNNPKMYDVFERFTFEAIKSGRKYFGSQSILERVRWFTAIESRDDIFKVNNNYAAFYSRMFEEKHPEWKGFFRKRASVADGGLPEDLFKG
jgi:hypothetical protein